MLPENFRGKKVLVSDFDGTITTHDYFLRVLERSDSPEVHRYWDDLQSGKLNNFDALKAIFAHVSGGESELLEIGRETGIDEDLPQYVGRLEQAGWKVIVVSAGCEWYIHRIFAERGIPLPVIANPGRLSADGRLEMVLPTDSPFYSRETGIDKAAVVRATLEIAEVAAFAGDGRPDLKAARLVEPTYRFACGWLAEALDKEGLSYRPFRRWSDVAEMLLE